MDIYPSPAWGCIQVFRHACRLGILGLCAKVWPAHMLAQVGARGFRGVVRGGLRCQEEDGGDVARLKEELQALLLALQERIQSLEVVQEQQDSAIQVNSLVACWHTAGPRAAGTRVSPDARACGRSPGF